LLTLESVLEILSVPLLSPPVDVQVLHEFVADLIKFHSMQALQDLYGLGGGAGADAASVPGSIRAD
jgi:hypothetical protein